MTRRLTASDGRPNRRQRYVRRVGALFGVGLLGVAALGVTLAVSGLLPAVPETSPLVVLALSLLTPTVLLGVAVLVGTRAADPVGLRSLVAERVDGGGPVWPELAAAAPRALGAGVVVGFLLAALDVTFSPLGAVPAAATPRPTLVDVLSSAPVRFLYGGLTEELLLRWGLMSALVWVGWRAAGGVSRPGRDVVWPAIVLTALVFGIGHLPALAGLGPLTFATVIRTVLLNALGGVVYGWFFWRYHLEAAMLAHAGTHVAFLFLSVLVVVLA
ncbi:CPBP family intramembrane glutamic endopeptidase [Halogeometricum limi]|uniref:CAAX protease self-immunity n=1 Tax=Halogeometricum limi TaxID=555875 RepID=A0A1I6G188_9EURY|nr:CPBP family intramembrane glutamic endopeptidase [Halogeometricum limi]SFR35948.1 CAAX protease self-immunity [Halogeometricum limi]